jgi:hypothetical protein
MVVPPAGKMPRRDEKCISKSTVNDALTRVPTPAMKLFFDDAEFDAQLQRTAAKTACRAADLGQILAVARRDFAQVSTEAFFNRLPNPTSASSSTATPTAAAATAKAWARRGTSPICTGGCAICGRSARTTVVLLDFSNSLALNGGEAVSPPCPRLTRTRRLAERLRKTPLKGH